MQVQDGTGIPHFPGGDSQFASDRHTPQLILCRTYLAWEQMIAAGAYLSSNAPFRYDLVNLGREVLAQLSTPVSQNFSDATKAKTLNIATLTATGQLYIDLLGECVWAYTNISRPLSISVRDGYARAVHAVF